MLKLGVVSLHLSSKFRLPLQLIQVIISSSHIKAHAKIEHSPKILNFQLSDESR